VKVVRNNTEIGDARVVSDHFPMESDKRGERSLSSKPSVLFVCVHNAGRSQMAAGYLNHLSGGAIGGTLRRQRTS
jgi:hypothetical protein